MFGQTTMYLTELHSLLETKMLTNALNSVAGSVLCYLVGPLGAKCSQELWLRASGTGGIWSPASRNAVQKPLLSSIRNCLTVQLSQLRTCFPPAPQRPAFPSSRLRRNAILADRFRPQSRPCQGPALKHSPTFLLSALQFKTCLTHTGRLRIFWKSRHLRLLFLQEWSWFLQNPQVLPCLIVFWFFKYSLLTEA